MGLITDVAFAPATGPLKGLLWLAKVIADQAERTLYDENVIRAGLATSNSGSKPARSAKRTTRRKKKSCLGA